jgi:16S rRNA processing protein RimM
MTDPNLLEIGRLGRAHGIRGEMFVSLTSDRVERVAEGSTLEAEGLWLTVVSSRPSSGRFIVRFAEIESRNDAEQMTGKVLRAHPLEDPEALWVHEMIGASGRRRRDGVGKVRGCCREPGIRPHRT